ncbi:MAG: nucleotidyl transferase AbiEii/AbiGii toxin family protein [Candidatus Delongbacteria bacterium]|nr:nucleotidyl transferase AbiEii/AbiGii toxin family protein [Candidatus Delongbacteria bacterium]
MEGFYLAGGTALALQIGHRKSIDLDFFSDNFPKREIIIGALKKFNPKITNETQGTIDMLINDVKLSILEYKYPLLEPLLNFEGVNIASVTDIACMKLSAISSRGSKKDFIDLYMILKNHSLSELFLQFEEKYVGVSFQKLIILKSLIFFADAEDEPDPDFTNNIDWEVVKKTIEKKVKTYLQKESI